MDKVCNSKSEIKTVKEILSGLDTLTLTVIIAFAYCVEWMDYSLSFSLFTFTFFLF